MTKSQTDKLAEKALRRFEGHNKPHETLVLFLHHGVFCEFLREPIEHRIRYIVENKPEDQIEARLTWMQPYVGHPEMQKADAEWKKAYAEWAKVDAEWNKAYAERNKAYAEWKSLYEPIFMAEHPDCPWNGQTLFP